MYRITELGRLFGLSRSTLLYYHRIGLLSPTSRTAAGYRVYSERERERLEAICTYRQAGLSIDDIRVLITRPAEATNVLQRRLRELIKELGAIQAKRNLLVNMLQVTARGWKTTTVDKATWVAMFQAAGMSDEAMNAWHREFERCAPEAHQAFLESLAIDEREIQEIRAHSGSSRTTPSRPRGVEA